MTPHLSIAANQGEIGGGEVMLLRLAEAAASLGLRVRVVGPSAPDDLVSRAAAEGHDVVAVQASSRRRYLAALAAWDLRHRRGLLWCNGLLPAVATAGRPNRVVHLHQAPRGRAQRTARSVATRRTRAVVVPSLDMGRRLPGTTVLTNWTAEHALVPSRTAQPTTLGFLGRLTCDKGVDVLAGSVGRLRDSGHDVRLVLAGDARFDDAESRRRVGAALDALGPAVQRLGWVAPEVFFAAVDLAVFPSVWAEPFGLVAAEALAFGVPLVVSDAGALPEVVGPEHPWVARRGNESDLSAVVATALGATPDVRAAVVAAGRRRWEAEYSPAAGERRLANLLADLGLPVDTARTGAGR